MTALMSLAVGLGATVPAGALAWTTVRLVEPLLKTSRNLSIMGSAALLLTVSSGLIAGLMHAPQRLMAFQLRLPDVPVAVMSATQAPKATDHHLDIAPILIGVVAVILIGVGVKLLWLLIHQLRAQRLVAAAAPLHDDGLHAAVRVRAAKFGVAAPCLRVSGTADTAMLIGVFRPVIVLPTVLVETQTCAALLWICSHELAHLQRGDQWRAIGDHLVLAALWFNPFAVDLVHRQIGVREALCDRAALADEGAAERRLYAALLIAALRLSKGSPLQPSFARRHRDRHAMRLKAILHPASRAKPPAMIAAASLLACCFSASLIADVAMAAVANPAAGELASEPRKSVSFKTLTTTRSTILRDGLAKTQATRSGIYFEADQVIFKGRSDIYSGHPTIQVISNAPALMTINGRVATADAVNAIAVGRIERIEVVHKGPSGPRVTSPNPLQSINIVMRPG